MRFTPMMDVASPMHIFCIFCQCLNLKINGDRIGKSFGSGLKLHCAQPRTTITTLVN